MAESDVFCGPHGGRAVYGHTLWGLWLPGENPADVAPAMLAESAEAVEALRQTMGYVNAAILPVRCARLAWTVPANEKPPEAQSASEGFKGPQGDLPTSG